MKLSVLGAERELNSVPQANVGSSFAAGKAVQIVAGELKNGETCAYFDKLRLCQVFDNVLSNGIKFNKKGGSITISANYCAEKSIMLVTITDTGGGIAAEHFGKVFNEFETVENIENHHKGTGLGMPICKKLMELMGGKIYFESELGAGTTFFVEIPTTKVLEESNYGARVSSPPVAA